MKSKRFWYYTIGYLMLSMLLSIVVGQQSYESGTRNLLDTYPSLNVIYAVFKVAFAAYYLGIIKVYFWEIIGLIGFALIIRFFAEGTFTIAIIGAMMAKRITFQQID